MRTEFNVWTFEPGIAPKNAIIDGKTSPVTGVCSLSKLTREGQFYYDPRIMRCPECYSEFSAKSTVIKTDDYVLVPCYECETVIKMAKGGT